MNFWILQAGEPLHIDPGSPRPMRAMNLANSLIDRGHSVVIWSSGFYHQEKRHRSKLYREIYINAYLKINLIPSPGYNKNIGLGRLFDHFMLSRNLKKALNEYKDEFPDLALVGYPPIEMAAVATKWFKSRNIPIVIDVKDMWPSIFLEPFPVFLRPVIKIILFPYYRIAKHTLQASTAMSSMSLSYLDWMADFAKRPLTISDSANPLTNKIENLSDQEYQDSCFWWSKLNISDKTKNRFCFIGSFMSVFDFSEVQKAATEFYEQDIECTFVICGDGGFSADIKRQFSGLPNVIFPGWIDRPKMQYLANCCSGALIPYKNIENYTRNIPNKVIDSLALGLPIITTLSGVVGRLVVNEGVGFLCNAESGITMRDALANLLRDPKLVADISERAKNIYERDYSYDNVYGSMVDKLELLAQGKE